MLLAVSILSTLAFGASNPGGEISSLPATVGVPMEVRVEVLPTSGKLVLVDENNKLIDKLIFDHEKTVKLKKDDGSAFGSRQKVTFEAKNSSGEKVNGTTALKLQAHGLVGGGEIDSNMKYRENQITLTGTEKEVETKVQSIIAATNLNVANPGLYIGSGTFEAKVENVD